jgi:heavy metal sensor kinase
MLFRSLRFKLVVWYILILALVIGISDLFLYRIFEKSLIDNIDNTLYTAAEEVQHAILLSPNTRWQQNVENVEKAFIVNRVFINLYRISGVEKSIKLAAKSRILLKSISSEYIQNFLDTRNPVAPLCLSINEKSHAMHPFRLILFPVVKNNTLVHIIQVGTSLKKVFSTMNQFRLILFLFAPIILIITSLGGYFILSKALSPVKNAVRTAQTITTEDLSLRIDSRGRKDEIGDLIRTFNDMIGRLEKSVEQIKHFSTEVSHELKTPLTIIRGEIEITLRKERKKAEYKKILKSVFDEALKLQKMVNSLLFLSHIITQEEQFTFGKVPLDEIVLKAFEHCEALARQKNIKLTINRIDAVSVFGEETLLNRMIINILENSLKYSRENGRVEISLENRKNQTVLTIRDNGIGIPRKDLPNIFERFFTVDKHNQKKQGGLGLGLAIVKRIADMHRANIRLQSTLAKGTTFRIIFPQNKKNHLPEPGPAGNIKKF